MLIQQVLLGDGHHMAMGEALNMHMLQYSCWSESLRLGHLHQGGSAHVWGTQQRSPAPTGQ